MLVQPTACLKSVTILTFIYLYANICTSQWLYPASVIRSIEHPALGWKEMENQVSGTISNDGDKLMRKARNARRKRNLELLTAVLWSISTSLMWFSFSRGNQFALAGAIAFSGISFMYWTFAIISSITYSHAVEKLSAHSK